MERARKKVIGKYKNAEEVRATLQRLERDGYAREDVTIYTNNSNVREYEKDYDVDMLADETRHVGKSEENRSFWDRIKDMVSYSDSDEGEMDDDENEFIAPYREDIDNGYTVIAVRENANQIGPSTDSDRQEKGAHHDESIPEAGAKYNQQEEPTAEAPGDFSRTETRDETADFTTRDKYIEHEHRERLVLGSKENSYTEEGTAKTDLEADRRPNGNLDGIADEGRPSDIDSLEGDSSTELNLDDNPDRDLDRELERGSADQTAPDSVNEPDSVLERELTNKDETLFDDPNHLDTEGNTFIDQDALNTSDGMNQTGNRRVDPNKDIEYDPTHRDMDL